MFHRAIVTRLYFDLVIFFNLPGYINSLKVLYSQSASKSSVNKNATQRQIPQQPERIMDAPELIDDYCKSLAMFPQCVRWQAVTSVCCDLFKVIIFRSQGPPHNHKII